MSQTSNGQLEQIIKAAEKAIKYGLGDPETALLHARRAGEAVCKDIYENQFQRPSKRLTFNNMIGELSQEDVFPRKVMYSLRVIQNFGGTSAHPNENIDECLEPALEFFSVIVKWYFEDYRKSSIPERIKFRKILKEHPVFPSVGEPVISNQKVELSSDLFRAYCLFGYETDGGRESALWDNPYRFHELLGQRGHDFHNRYDSWLQTKRNFSDGEVKNGRWVKIGDHGHQFHIKFLNDGIIHERHFFGFNESDYWEGTWKLIDGTLRLNFSSDRLYELDIVASRDGIHAGVEDADGQRNAYYRLIHVK
jgi:hypothetical protein